ncbi:MAG: hypothetical protein AAB544_00165 [Patescibacteria group bacterium]
MEHLPQNAVTLAAYLAGIATILVFQAIQPETNVVVPGAANILARPPVTADQATSQPSQPPPPSTPDPACSCSQPQVLRCTDAANRSKHTFCPGGCESTEGGARCL